MRKLCQYKHNNDTNPVIEPVIVDTISVDDVQENKEVKENFDKAFRGRNDNVCNRKVKTNDNNARNVDDKTVKFDLKDNKRCKELC